MKKMKLLMWSLFFFFLIALVGRFYLREGLPTTHDSVAHLLRFANYKMALRQGQFPPRLAPNLMNGYGYPAFNYNYPLANILSLPFSVLNVHYETTFKILMLAALLLALASAKSWLETLGYKKSVLIFALLALALNPYLYASVIFRGNIGEIMAVALLIAILAQLAAIKQVKPDLLSWRTLFLTLTLMAFFLAHNIAAFFGSGLIIFYLLFDFAKNWKLWKIFLASFVLAFSASLWFWLPALMEKSLVILDKVDLSINYYKHFPNISQLISWPLSFGYSYWGNVDSMSLGIGLLQIAILILSLVFVLQKNPTSNSMKVWFFVAALFIFGQLTWSRPFYDNLPFFSFIQFPWRLAMLLMVALVPISALLFSRARFGGRMLLFTILLVQLLQFYQVKPVDYHHRDRIDYEHDPSTTTTNHENRPINFEYDYGKNREQFVEILDGTGSTAIERFFITHRKFNINLDQDSRVVEASVYFAGFETKVDGKKVDYIDDEDVQGRLAYVLAKGEHQVETRFTQNTPARLIGNGVSLVSYFILLICFYLIYQKEKRDRA